MSNTTTKKVYTREIVEQSRNIHYIRQDFDSSRGEFWYLLSSDGHWDNPDCDREMMKRHLKECRERGAVWLHFGDFYCAMQGKYDKRSDKSKIRPEHQTPKYLDSLVSTAADWLSEFSDVPKIMGLGNHETAILKNHETNLIERLIERLNANGAPNAWMAGYGGWVKFQFRRVEERQSINLKYHHGHGGGGPVTKGVIQSQRQAVYLPDADVVISGHVHEQYTIAYVRERLTDNGKIKLDEQWHVRTPTYKDEYKDGYGGYHIENGRPPKPVGAYWMKVSVIAGKPIHFDFLRAK
jgi:hypothetical protein